MLRTSSLAISIVSTVGPDGIGGLSAYSRHLAAGLGERHSVNLAARFLRAGPAQVDYAATSSEARSSHGDVTLIRPSAGWTVPLRMANHLVHRQASRRVAVAAARSAWGPPLSRGISARTDVVHFVGTGWELLGFAAMREAERRGAAFTVWPALHPGVWGDSELDASLYTRANVVFAQSMSEWARLVALGVDSGRLRLAPLAPASPAGGDGSRFREKHGLGDRPLVLFVGRRQRYKGFHALCSAMGRVVRAVPDACLVVIGASLDPPYPRVPEGALLDLGESDEQTKADAFAACDVFCLPSSGEAFGIVYLEAWQYGKPVVAGMAPAARELVGDGEFGLCVPQVPDQIADALIALLLDDGLRARLGDAGRRLQASKYTWDAVVRAHEEAFVDALAGRSARASL